LAGPCLVAISGMRVLIVNVRSVNIVALDIIAWDVAPHASGVILEMGVIVRCICERWFGVLVARQRRTRVRCERKSHWRTHESGDHCDNEYCSHWVISMFEWIQFQLPAQ